jgi:hypothetical protein
VNLPLVRNFITSSTFLWNLSLFCFCRYPCIRFSWPLLSFCFGLVFVKSIYICIKNSRRGMKLFYDYLRGCQVIFWKDWWGMNFFSNFIK